MSISDHIKQQVVQEFFAKKVSFSWKTAKLVFFCSVRVGEVATYRKYVTYLELRQHGKLF